MATSPIRIGEIADTPQPGAPVASAWTQEITNRIRHRFASTTARDSQWPPASAGAGATCITLDTLTVWECSGTAWTAALAREMGYVENLGGGSYTTLADVSGLTVTWTAVPSHKYKLTAFVPIQQLTSSGVVDAKIATGANVQVSGSGYTLGINDYMGATLVKRVTGLSGSQTYKVRLGTNAGSVTVNGSPNQPATFLVEDLGL